VRSYEDSSHKEAGAEGYIARVAGAVEPNNEGGVDAEDDLGYPKVGKPINDNKHVIPHDPDPVWTWILPALPIFKRGRVADPQYFHCEEPEDSMEHTLFHYPYCKEEGIIYIIQKLKNKNKLVNT